MAEKDIAEKNLEALNDVFADIVNVLLFKGEQIIQENELEGDTTRSMFKADGKIHEQERDVSKFWKNGEIRIAILGFENQTVQDYKMPLRVISYDGASYKKQLLDKKLEKNFPVATLVLYFGTKNRWTAPKNLCACFEIPKEIKPFVSDYQINVFEIAWLDDDTIEKFQSDFKIVAKYFQTKRLNADYKGSKEQIKHVDETLNMLSVLTGDDSFEKVYNEHNFRRGGVTMCEVVEKIRNDGKNEGLNEGKADVIRKLLDAKALTVEQLATGLNLPVEEVKKIAEKVPVKG